MQTTIYLIRHAQSAGNLKRTFQGCLDVPVSPLGEKQLEALANRCRTLSFDAVYSSPLTRAKQTAEAVNRYHGLPICFDDRLREIYGGDWEGKPWDSFPVTDPEQNDNWRHHPAQFCAPHGEPMRAVRDRMMDVLQELATCHRGQTICVVSHGSAMGCVLNEAMGRSFDELTIDTICDNTAINKLSVSENGSLSMVFYNDTSHLDPSLFTGVSLLWEKKEKA